VADDPPVDAEDAEEVGQEVDHERFVREHDQEHEPDVGGAEDHLSPAGDLWKG